MTNDDHSRPEPSLTVVEKISQEEGTDPTELDDVLANVIDPIALDSLFESTAETKRDSGLIEFRYCGYTVRVWADGTVRVRSSE